MSNAWQEESVARQLRFLTAQGLDTRVALERLGSVAPEEMQGGVAAIEALLDAPQAGVDNRDLLGRFIRRARDVQAEPAAALSSMLSLKVDMKSIAGSLFRRFQPKTAYIAAIALLGVFVSVIWVNYVWPSLLWVYTSVNAAPPLLAATSLKLGLLGFPLVFLLLLAVVLVYLGAVWLQTRDIRSLRPWNFVFMSTGLKTAGNTLLTTSICGAFREAGLPDRQSLALSGELLGGAVPVGLKKNLELALDCGTFGNELDYQVSQSRKDIERLGEKRGKWPLLVLRIVLFALIALALLAFYEPIFGFPGAFSEKV